MQEVSGRHIHLGWRFRKILETDRKDCLKGVGTSTERLSEWNRCVTIILLG